MKKIIYTIAFVLGLNGLANAETLVVIDENGVVTKQIYTTNDNVSVNNNSTVTVIRESPNIKNSYYYDRYATRNAMIAGITTAVVGGFIYDGYRHHKRHLQRPKKLHRPRLINHKHRRR